MIVERRTVSRKTPGDGRLEITKQAARTFEALGTPFDVDVGGQRATARLDTMDCTCRGVENPHVHYFIESTAFKQLAPGTEVDLELDPGTNVVRLLPS